MSSIDIFLLKGSAEVPDSGPIASIAKRILGDLFKPAQLQLYSMGEKSSVV